MRSLKEIKEKRKGKRSNFKEHKQKKLTRIKMPNNPTVNKRKGYKDQEVKPVNYAKGLRLFNEVFCGRAKSIISFCKKYHSEVSILELAIIFVTYVGYLAMFMWVGLV